MEYRICSRCVMDTSDPDIIFDNNGFCNHCGEALVRATKAPYVLGKAEKTRALEEMIDKIRLQGTGKIYDCVIGLSGGVDSSYVAYLVKRVYGLRPLAIHLDNGWNTEKATNNIENICKILNIDLMTKSVNWSEFKDLQIAFLRASTPDAEVPSDHAIVSILYEEATKQGIHWIINGVNHASESILPKAWARGHDDWKYIRSVWRIFGKLRNCTYPHRGFFNDALYRLRIHSFSILDYINYNKEIAKDIIATELGWIDYGRKHGESLYTKFLQEYILPLKFGFDKRRAHLSSLIVSGQLERQEAIDELEVPLYPDAQKAQQDIKCILDKLELSREEFEKIMENPPKSIFDYPNSQKAWYRSIGYAIYRKIFKK